MMTATANAAEVIGDKSSSGRLPSAVARHGVAAPSGAGTSHATHAVVAARVISAPQSVPNANGSRFAIQRVIATVLQLLRAGR